MATPSDDSGDEVFFTDGTTSGGESHPELPDGRQRRVSVPEMVRRAEQGRKTSKRNAPDRGSKSPRDTVPPAAKRSLTGSAEPSRPARQQLTVPAAAGQGAGVELSASSLAAIRELVKELVNGGIAPVVKLFEATSEKLEKRIELLESAAMDQQAENRRVREQLSHQTRINAQLRAQLESMDLNTRLALLIFTCDDFGRR